MAPGDPGDPTFVAGVFIDLASTVHYSQSTDEIEITRIINPPLRVKLWLLHSVCEIEVVFQFKVAERSERLTVLAGPFKEEANRLMIGIQVIEALKHFDDSLNRDLVDCAPVAL